MSKLKYFTDLELPGSQYRSLAEQEALNSCLRTTLDSYKIGWKTVKYFMENESGGTQSKYMGVLLEFLEMCENNLYYLVESPEHFIFLIQKSVLISSNTLFQLRNYQKFNEIFECSLDVQVLLDSYLALAKPYLA